MFRKRNIVINNFNFSFYLQIILQDFSRFPRSDEKLKDVVLVERIIALRERTDDVRVLRLDQEIEHLRLHVEADRRLSRVRRPSARSA